MKKKIITIFALSAAVMFNVIPSYASTASSNQTKVSSSSSGSDYTKLPDAETLKKDVGFVPKLLETMAKEFQFKEGSITEISDYDSKGAVVNSRKGISFSYSRVKNDSTQTISLSAEPAGNQTYSEKFTITKYGDYILYSSEEQGNSVAWVDDEISYMFMDINRNVTIEEMKTMAKELIDLNKK